MPKKKENWVNYKELKEKISLEAVLRRYGAWDKLKKSGANLAGCCPIHEGSNSRQFSVNLARNIWHCFGNCQEGGNVIDLVALKEFGSKEPESIRQAALLLKNWFLASDSAALSPGAVNQGQSAPDGPKMSNQLDREEKSEAEAKNPQANPPLKFELKKLEPEHLFFKERGIKPATVEYFGLGYSTKGLMAGRIAIPIHNRQGELVAYCGRALTPAEIENEKYKQPRDFHKSAELYNLHRLEKQAGPLIIVESFISVWWLYQAGYRNVVALMGSSLSEAQAELIIGLLTPQGRAILLLDPDEAGAKGTADALERLSKQVFVKALDLSPFKKKPHQLTHQELKTLF